MILTYKRFFHLVGLLVFSCVLRTAAQPLTDFPHPCWQQKGVFQWDFNAGNNAVRNVVTYLNDTTVCGLSFKKLLQEQYNWGPTDSTHLFVRNNAGKVYLSYAPSCTDSGSLLFDFTLMPGDTFVKFNGLSNFIDTVAAVETMMIDGEPRKKITFTFATWDVWIDGIGDSTRGLLNQPVGFEGAHYELVCQRDSNGIVFVYVKPPYPVDSTGYLHICDSIPAAEPCDIANTVNRLENILDISVYPNPANGLVQVSIPFHQAVSIVSIVDVIGKTVFETTLDGDRQTMDVSHLPPGVFVVHAVSAAQSYSTKLLIER